MRCAEDVKQPKGKRRPADRRRTTPLEIFSQISQCETYLRPGVSMADREAECLIARAIKTPLPLLLVEVERKAQAGGTDPTLAGPGSAAL
jgi:hypothetical protein